MHVLWLVYTNTYSSYAWSRNSLFEQETRNVIIEFRKVCQKLETNLELFRDTNNFACYPTSNLSHFVQYYINLGVNTIHGIHGYTPPPPSSSFERRIFFKILHFFCNSILLIELGSKDTLCWVEMKLQVKGLTSVWCMF